MSKRPKRPRDANQLAKSIVDIATGEAEDESKKSAEEIAEEEGKDPAAVALGRKGGLKGGKARAAKMTPEERSEAAKKAAKARWEKKD
ncbi:MAG: hypothetical protein AB2610_14960 [Candidatus Thiodiazotropha sp.]